MSLTTQTRTRLPQIKQGLREGLNYTQIGQRCGVTEKTIDRDMAAFVNSGEFETWLKTEYVELYEHARATDPILTFRELSKIMSRMLTKVESKHIEEIREIKVLWLKDESNPSNQI